MATNQQSINYDKLLSGNIQFKKDSNTLTIPIDNNILKEISEFVSDLNDKNISYEKKDNVLIIITKSTNVIQEESFKKLQQEFAKIIVNKLLKLNNKYNVDKTKNSYDFDNFFDIKDNGNNCVLIFKQNCMKPIFLSLKKENNIMFMEILGLSNRKVKIPFTTIADIQIHMIYVLLCLVDMYIVEVNGNDIKIDSFDGRKYSSFHFGKNTDINTWTLHYFNKNKWTDRFSNTGSVTYDTHNLLSRI